MSVCLSVHPFVHLPENCFVLLHFLLSSPLLSFLLLLFPPHCLPIPPFLPFLTLDCWHKPPSLTVLTLSEKLSNRRQVVPVWEQMRGTCLNSRQPGRRCQFPRGPTPDWKCSGQGLTWSRILSHWVAEKGFQARIPLGTACAEGLADRGMRVCACAQAHMLTPPAILLPVFLWCFLEVL